ncbi:imidazole glycerol phosphate synthase subunit HisH [Candidatus Pelagibacter sp. HIMB1321]|uniref:imidazole glycerol phosphate synthase subunit HisH n=1 Tax=Candidatus Pelagibacter sp. HIMB1321 TaxID=1388755 RepID=UPI000A07F32A|nr:imidazole glycerol phosphate synthase subunit HisH [Candidatus Pelagibacter sp. HIMB1321]SMF79594.1 glutamine amidotransferase [Candidatus Pelagibacter sp. HIMB1321]
MKYISIINTGINNLKSIIGALNYLGFQTKVTNDKNIIMNSSALILPGVGSFPAGMEKLKSSGLEKTIKNFFKKGKPILAICLGFQMLFSSSNEFKNTKGLNLLDGKVKSLKDLKTSKLVPNLGWNNLNFKKNKNNNLFKDIDVRPSIYFIHSYYVEVKDKKYITSTIDFGGKKVATSIQYKNLFGVQFHPEKSGLNGLKIIQNFLNKIS